MIDTTSVQLKGHPQQKSRVFLCVDFAVAERLVMQSPDVGYWPAACIRGFVMFLGVASLENVWICADSV